MDKIVFKGIKQVTMETYQSATDKKGYLWFVRETIQKQEGSQSPFEENRFHIYFGDKKYGDFWGGLYESIGALVEAINQQSIAISNKQEIISDLETIRSNAAKGATALQEVPEEYVTETELEEKGYLTSHQDISHLAEKTYVDEKITETVQHCDSKVFIGTQEEYDIACAEGKVAVGALVIILDENEANSDATTAMLGKAIIGTLLLGRA
jgi:hypothetical protein